ncbi:Uncharacterised protein [Segatella copri]|nr:Uncharacterised protein [Segatella copri]
MTSFIQDVCTAKSYEQQLQERTLYEHSSHYGSQWHQVVLKL